MFSFFFCPPGLARCLCLVSNSPLLLCHPWVFAFISLYLPSFLSVNHFILFFVCSPPPSITVLLAVFRSCHVNIGLFTSFISSILYPIIFCPCLPNLFYYFLTNIITSSSPVLHNEYVSYSYMFSMLFSPSFSDVSPNLILRMFDIYPFFPSRSTSLAFIRVWRARR